MRELFVALIGIAAVGCGARSVLEAPSSSNGGSSGSSANAGGPADAGDAGDAGPIDGSDAQAPVPTCSGALSQCIEGSNGMWTGAAVIHCDGVYFVGPWTLVLERSVGNDFHVVQVQAVQEPGFGATFDDMTGPPVELTYRVCVADAQGVRCGAPFNTYGPVDCKCRPETCDILRTCHMKVDDGCGGVIECGACSNGVPCNTHNNSCCPVGEEGDGNGGCECAPLKPCAGSQFWDPNDCECEATFP